MVLELCIGWLYLSCADALPIKGMNSADSQFVVWFPICLVALLIIIGLLWCYCHFRRSPYEALTDSITSIDLNLPVGLQNNGSECYMNSAIQALASSDKLIHRFMELEDHMPYSNALQTLLKLLKGVNRDGDNTASVLTNTTLLKSLVDTIGWHKASQQDCHDFMSAIINAIHRDLKRVAQEVEPPMKFEMLHKIRGCDFNDKIQSHISMSLSLCGPYRRLPGVQLDYLINEYLSSSNIDGDSLKTTQMFFFKKSPDVLVLHIQASIWDPVTNAMVKPEYYIQYDRFLQLDLTIMNHLEHDETFEQKVNYKLHAVISHMGNSSNGHYITYRNFKRKWVLTNDQQIEVVNFNESVCPYILIYEKIEGSIASWI